MKTQRQLRERVFLFCLFILISVQTSAQTATKQSVSAYEEKWKQVNEMVKADRPESALELVAAIKQLALAENNSAQQIKASTMTIKLVGQKDPDKLPSLLAEMETSAAKSTNETMKAMLNSIIAEYYLGYYQSESYTINRRTPIKGNIPANYTEWSGNIFTDTIHTLLAQSLVPAERLQITPVKDIMDLLTQHDTVIEPSVYDVLARRRITLLNNLRQIENDRNVDMEPTPLFTSAEQFIKLKVDAPTVSVSEREIMETLQQWLQLRLKDGNAKAYLHTDVYRLKTLYLMAYDRNNSGVKSLPPTSAQQLYLRTLQELSIRYADNELVLKVLYEQAQYYMAFYRVDDPLYNDYRYKAYKLTEKGLSRFPRSSYNNDLRQLQFSISYPGINLTAKTVVMRNTPLEVKVRALNTDKAELTVYRINLTAKEFLKQQSSNNRETVDMTNCTVLERRTITFNTNSLFNPEDTTLVINGLEYGQYGYSLCIPGNNARLANAYFVVSDMACIDKTNNTELCVVDRVTGKPYADVTVQAFSRVGTGSGFMNMENPTSSGKTDKDGFFSYITTGSSTSNFFIFERGADCHLTSQYNGYNFFGGDYTRVERQLSLLTDRSIYRPGQTVYFKGIAYDISRDVQRVVPNERYEVELLDANNQSVKKQTLTTNEFGSFSGSFVLPEAGLNGYYRLRSDNYGGASFQVEEYKRPTFQVELKKPETAVEFGKIITVSGLVKAYAGYPVTGATVTYQVTRRAHARMVSYSSSETILSGKAQTNDDGTFTVSFPAERMKNWEGLQVVTYGVSTTVTDQKGETRESRSSVSVGDKSLFIYTDLYDNTIIEKKVGKPIKVSVTTINNTDVPAEVGYELYLLDPSKNFIDAEGDKGYISVRENERVTETQRKPGRLVKSGRFNTKDGPLNLNFKAFASGPYQLVCTTTDTKGNKEQNISEFTLYSPYDTRIPVKAYAWMDTENSTFAPSKPAVIHFGTAANNVFVLYRIVKGKTCLKSTWIPLSNKLETFTIPYVESYGDGVTVEFTFVKDEKLFARSVRVTYTIEKKELKPILSVFRDKLQPGETATWTIAVPEVKTLNKPAEVLALMYDASLDAIYRYYLGFNPIYYPSVPYAGNWSFITPKNVTVKQIGDLSYFIQMIPDLSTIDYSWMGGLNPRRSDLGFSIPKREISVAAQTLDFGELEGLQVSSVDEALQGRIAGLDIVSNSGDPIRGLKSEDSNNDLSNATEITPRRIFNETAFFYPQLLTDEAGNVKFTFTVPESLTRWNVNLLAHTKDLYYGSFKTQVETQKDLMVQLNLPRFVRQLDKPVLSATVVNLSDKPLTTNVTLELLYPADEKPISGSLSSPAVQTLTLGPKETRSVSWNLNAQTSNELIICKVVASAGTFSDGEQRYLPVLPDKQLVTETLPLTVSVNKTRQYTLEQVVNPAQGVSPYALTVEFSPNPSWTAIQALPTVADPSSNNALDYFTAYYVNTLAGHIVQSYPKLTAVFDQWRQTGNTSALLSTLSKNQELKTLLLEETPWVVAANDETEQRRQLALLFDLNQQKSRQSENWKKLLKLQDASGGFIWFENMPVNRYVTYYILLNQARLNAIINPGTQPANAVLKALAYADKTLADDYEALKRQPDVDLSTRHIGDMQWFYLHLRSMYPTVKLPDASKEAVAYYTKQAETYWTQATLYGKAATALIAARNGNKTLATAILTALKEQSLTKEDMGMYWATNKAGYGWNERPVMVQTMLLEAFAELQPKTAPLDAMKTWLLRQKQTQRWDSPLSTVDAIYALLHYGQDWFNATNEVSLKLGDITVPTASKEIGTGYIQHAYKAVDIMPSMGNITVGLKSATGATVASGMGWGAVYYQFFQNIDQIKAQGNELTVSKQLFVEQASAIGTVMVPIAGQTLKPGDKVITRLIVTVDRSMDFVVLKDQRAACFEPAKQLSGYVWREGVGYYQTSKDASTQFFFSSLPKGSYAFEYPVYVNNAGTFTDGVASLQCMYAPEFSAHSNGGRIEVKPAAK